MRELILMVVVLTLLSALSGLSLSALRQRTAKAIENQELKFVKGPAIDTILKGASNDPLANRFKMKVGDEEKSFFVGVFDGKPDTVAFETFGKGFGDTLGLMVGINVDDDKIVGVNVTLCKETPGLGARSKTDPNFVAQFKGLPATEGFKVNKDGGQIDALSGATITSRAVCVAASKATKIYKELKPQLVSKMKELKK